jgi:hypothetical protein
VSAQKSNQKRGDVQGGGKIAIGVEVGPVEGIERGDELAAIEQFSEDGGLGDSNANGDEPQRVVPARHFRT